LMRMAAGGALTGWAKQRLAFGRMVVDE
jgi:hypothetical protein